MQIEPLGNIQSDLEDTAAQLAALARLLEGHAVYLRHGTGPNTPSDVASIERQIRGLAASVSDLRGVARQIAKVA